MMPCLIHAASRNKQTSTFVMTVMLRAQAWLEDSSLVIPLTVGNGAAPVISRLTPFTGASMQVGDKNSSDYFKYVKPQEKVVTKKEYEQSREKWLKEKKVSNDKAQKDLAKHVK